MKILYKKLTIVLSQLLLMSLGYSGINQATAEEPHSELYVRTVPEGAKVLLDGKELGTSPGLFPVKSGDYKIVIDMEGYQAEEQKITIREGRITRIELSLKSAKAAPENVQHNSIDKKTNNKVIEGVGWGAFKLGTSRDELIKLIGQPDPNPDPNIQWVRWLSKYHVDCLFDDARGAFEIRFNKGFKLPLTSGIKIGSTEKAILTAYGAPDRVVNRPEVNAKMLEYDNHGILMWIHNGKVSDFTVIKGSETKKQNSNILSPASRSIVFKSSESPISGDAEWEEDELVVQADEAATVRLFELPVSNIDDCTILYQFKIKTEDLKASVYPEMLCHFPNTEEAFSRGMDQKLKGTNNWTSVQIPFFLKKGELPDLLKLNLVFEGAGSVRLKDIVVSATTPKNRSSSKNLIIESSSGDNLEIQVESVILSDTSSDKIIQLDGVTSFLKGAPKLNSGNLLKNSDIEDGTDRPDNWDQGAVIEGVNYGWDKNVGYKSKSSLCIEKTANKYFPIAQGSQTIIREGNQPTLNVSAYVKAEKMTKAVIDVAFLDENDNLISHKWVSYIGSKTPNGKPATHDWKKYSGSADIPSNTKKMVIGLQVHGPGKVWFDDVQASYAGGEKSKAELSSELAPKSDVTDSEAAEEILQEYAEAVWKELPPKLENVNNPYMEKIIVSTSQSIANQIIIPNKDLIDRYLLDRVQKASPIAESDWDSATAINLTELGKASPKNQNEYWDPVQIAYSSRMMVIMNKLGTNYLPQYSTLLSCAPVPMLLTDADIDHPKFVSAFPDCVIMINLERNKQGMYRCSEIRQSSQLGVIKLYRALPADITPAKKVFWNYSNKAWDELLPRLKEMKADEVCEAASKIAESEFISVLDILKKDGAQTLNKLPKSVSIDRSLWHSKLDDETKKAKLESIQLMINKMQFLPVRWNPIQLADWIKMILFTSTNSVESTGKLVMLSTIAGNYLNKVIDDNPESPIIVIPYGNDLFIIHLHRNNAGLYDLQDFEWLTKNK